MPICVQELNEVVANMDENLIYAVLNYAKNIKKYNRLVYNENNVGVRLGVARDRVLYNPKCDFHKMDEEIMKDFGV